MVKSKQHHPKPSRIPLGGGLRNQQAQGSSVKKAPFRFFFINRQNLIVVAALAVGLIALFAFAPLPSLNGFVKAVMPGAQEQVHGATSQLHWGHSKGEKHITIDIVDDDRGRQLGLSHRYALPDQYGMLFLYARKQIVSFWMKDTFIPLDIIFIDAKGRVVHIAKNNQPHDLTAVTSPQPVSAVLEVAAGKAKDWHIEVGTVLNHKVFR